jgi:hypothetical protein
MKVWLPVALMTLSFTALAQKLTQVPFYFAISEEAHLPLADKSWFKVPMKGVNSDKAYLRGYHFQDGSVGGRKVAFKELLAKGIIQTGDVVVSFRPQWENTIPYAHIQMGVSHSGLAFVENGVVRNLDMPLDMDYNGPGITGGFDSKHYLDTPQIQILRPRNFTKEKQTNLLAWIGELRKNYSSIRNAGLMKFNPDYSNAKIDRYSKEDSFVTTMARILMGKDKTSTNLTMFCSEYVWAMLSLSSCAPSDADFSNPTVSDASCVRPVFNPMMMTANGAVPGITEGPFEVLNALDISDSQKADLLKVLFAQGEMSGLSSGHKALATNPQVLALIEGLKMYYPAKLTGKDAVAMGISSKINPSGGRNYSPTSFQINAMLDQLDPERKFDYVATIMFGN